LYLIDTNVLRELAKEPPNKNVAAWYSDVDETNIFLSVIAVMESRKGIENLRKKKPQAAAEIEKGLLEIIDLFQDRIVSIDSAVAHQWGRMLAAHDVHVLDTSIAAAAREKGFAVVTRNTPDYLERGVRVVNPYKKPVEVIEPT
jgi:predicted nucleic acid-binding protein